MECKRVHAVASGQGICLRLSDNGIDYEGVVFDAGYRPRATFQIDGVPDRARVSRDGRYAAYTAFDEAGAAGYFASTDAFTTNTAIVEMRSGRELLDLDDVVVRRGRGYFERLDTELWGVAFPGGTRYYATLAYGAPGDESHFLIEGDVRRTTARVVARRIECASFSPDGTRIAYKRRIGDSNRWRLHVRDLDSGEDVELAETRSIDDQPEWVGDDLVSYSDDQDTFVVAADGSGEPTLIARRATSPALLTP